MMKKNILRRSLTWITLCCLLLSLTPAFAAECDQSPTGKHEFFQAEVDLGSCTEDAYYIIECKHCGYREKHITQMASGHVLPPKPARSQKPTCDAQGWNVFICEECGEEVTFYVPALGHQWKDLEVLEEPTCENEGYMRTVCTRCKIQGGYVLPKKNHVFGPWKITLQATDHSMGKRERACLNCDRKETGSFYPDGTLYRNMKKNDAVKDLQQKLTDMGFLRDKIDGLFGKKTEKAVKDYQKSARLEVTGVGFPQTLQALEKDWQKAMGPDVPAPTDVPQFPQNQALCERHQPVEDACAVLLKNADTPEKKARACQQIQSLWQSEVENLYDELIEKAPEEERYAMRWSEKAFFLSLNAHRTDLEILYAGHPENTEEQLAVELREQCIRLCRQLNLISSAPADVTGPWILAALDIQNVITSPEEAGMGMTLILNRDQTARQNLVMGKDSASDDGSWEQQNHLVTITFENDPARFYFCENVLVTEEMDGVRMIFAREKLTLPKE